MHARHPLETRVRQAMARWGPVRPGERVAAAVSGGPDSLCLLRLLAGMARTEGFAVHAVHFDHGLRGEESAADARFVQAIADRWGVPVHVGRAAPGTVRAQGRGLQAAARDARYAFFDEIADAIGARWVATAHTADDQAETVMMRWVRGAGPAALSGIPPVRGRLIRPLLACCRAEILAYLAGVDVAPRRDPSNDDHRFTRAKVRHTVLPALRDLNPRVVDALGRSAGLLADDAAWLDLCAEEQLVVLIRDVEEGAIELERSGLGTLHPALRRRVIRRALARIHPEAGEISFEPVEAIGEQSVRRTSGRLALGMGLTAEFAAERIRFASGDGLPRRPPEAVALPPDGACSLKDWGLVATLRVASGAPVLSPPAPHVAVFDLDRLPGRLMVRGWRRGDAFYPEGMRGRQRLHDYWINARIPRWRRDRIPLLVAG
ncbi:MAG: tRNA lysidine(34) synthetase TilS, partial [Nitrospiria bacterium]